MNRTFVAAGRFLTGALCVAVLLPFAGVGQTRVQAPIERSGFLRLTSYDSLRSFLGSISGNGRVRIEKIATTRQGRSVMCCYVSSSPRFGEDKTKLRVMLFAQQHGDEPSGKEALTVLLAEISNGSMDDLLSHVDLLVIPQVNADGAEAGKRRTADSLDLNRNHLLLTSPEPRALHDLYAQWKPQVTLDIHEFGPYSKSWSDSGFIKLADVQLGMLTNLNSPEVLRDYQRKAVFPSVAQVMRSSGYAFHEYIVGAPGEGIRYSTTEPNDGRQSFSILGTLSFIQEGRGGRSPEDNLARRTRSQLMSVEALLSFCASHGEEIRAHVSTARQALTAAAGKNVVLCMDHFSGGGVLTIPVRLVPSQRDSVWQVTPLHDVVKPLVSRRLPSAYIVPGRLDSIRALLDRHRIPYEKVKEPQTKPTEVYLVDTVRADTLEAEWHPMPSLRPVLRSVEIRPGDLIVRTNQEHALFLGILLEPESMWGLVKYPGFRSLLDSTEYAILRIP